MEAALPDFPIVDAHVHLYDPEYLTYPWMKDVPLLNKLHDTAYYSERSAPVKIDKLVFVEVDVADGSQVEEARWVENQAKNDARVQGLVVSAPLERGPAAVEADIAAMARLPHVRAVRRLIQGHAAEPGWCLRPDFVEAVKLLPRYGLGFDICIFHPQMRDAIELVSRCPEVSFILDHIGKPGIKAGIREPWWHEIAELAELPNVVCKISGVVTEADHQSWTYDQIAPYVSRVLEVFGFDRCAFGSDWSVSELATTYADWVAVVDRITAGASRAELEGLYRDTATRFYRL
jgi:L-fuconolactonase